MSDLTSEEREIIEQNPLGDALSAVRVTLREASAASEADDSASGPERPRLFTAAIGKLFQILSGSEVCLSIASRTGSYALGSDLVAVRLRLQNGELEYHHVRRLSWLVIKQASDVDIWTATIALVRTISHPTPPPSQPSSLDTPITHSSASQQGSEQTRRQIEPRVFEEIRHCTYRGVQGFHEKYFEGKTWNRRATRVWHNVQCLYSETDTKWSQLSEAPTEDEMCGFWLDIQQKLLAKERCAFFRSTVDKQVGTDARRQLDLFSKKTTSGTSAKHEWKDALVVGELKESGQNAKGLWLQVGSAVRNVFASQPTRLFVHAFTLTGTEMETWVFDRSGPYSGAIFNIHKEPAKFINVMCGYLMMSDAELGLDTFTKVKDNRRFVTLLEARGEKRKRKLELEPDPIAHQRAIVCRGTSCFRAKATGATEFDSVIKFSWTSSMRPPEADLLQKANDRGVKGIAELVAYQEEVTSISKLREGLVFSTPYKFRGVPRSAHAPLSRSQPTLSRSFSQFPGLSIVSNGSGKRKSTGGSNCASKRPRSNSQRAEAEAKREDEVTYPVQEPQGTSLVQESTTPYDNRILRILAISPAGRSISQFTSITELLEGLRDALKVHRSLFTEGKILHRDISENNIIITKPERADGFRGMLIDLDLAKEEGEGPSGARHRTGTMEFMAIEVLQGISHTYRHDLEAFFYVLLWLCARRGWALAGVSKKRAAKTVLSHWYTGTYSDIARNKRGDMDKNGLEVILGQFPDMFDCIKPLCRKIRDVLFPYQDGLFTGTPQDSRILYDPIIQAFETTLAGNQQALRRATF